MAKVASMGYEEGRKGNRKYRVADFTDGIHALGSRSESGNGTDGGPGQTLASPNIVGACRTGGGLGRTQD